MKPNQEDCSCTYHKTCRECQHEIDLGEAMPCSYCIYPCGGNADCYSTRYGHFILSLVDDMAEANRLIRENNKRRYDN